MTVMAVSVAACATFPEPGGYNPVKLLCSGDYDVEQARCTVPVDLQLGAELTP
ncbi:MAG: hypothetical protein J4F47_03490 [Alphaproteobacteria bacterium]|nr:hypothetical protein [Alphaproteobacteria bacterium]